MIETDLSRFFDALQRVFPSDMRGELRNILVVGAGRCEPCVKLLAVFPNARLTTIDLDDEDTKRAAALLVDLCERVHILTGDAGALSELAPGPYDLTIIRHPDVDRNPSSWETVLAACVTQLGVGGVLFMTTYSLPEATFADRVMGSLPVSMRPGSPYTAASVALKGNDRYILVYDRVNDVSLRK